MKTSTIITIPLCILTFSAVGMWGYTLYHEITYAGQERKPGIMIDDKTVSNVYGFDERFFEFKMGAQSGSGQSALAQPVSAQRVLLTKQAIQARYTLAFAQLQQDLDSRITQMKQAASVDYNSCKQKGSPSIPQIIIKYTTVGNKLQAGADQAFYAMLAQMKQELHAAGLSTDLANRAEQEYKTQMQHKKTELIMKGKSKI